MTTQDTRPDATSSDDQPLVEVLFGGGLIAEIEALQPIETAEPDPVISQAADVEQAVVEQPPSVAASLAVDLEPTLEPVRETLPEPPTPEPVGTVSPPAEPPPAEPPEEQRPARGALRPSAPRPVVIAPDATATRRLRATVSLFLTIIAAAVAAALVAGLTIAAIALVLQRAAG